MQRHSQRSLRRKIIEQANEGLQMDQSNLIGIFEKMHKLDTQLIDLFFNRIQSELGRSDACHKSCLREVHAQEDGSR